jgi:hypothetical protein
MWGGSIICGVVCCTSCPAKRLKFSPYEGGKENKPQPSLFKFSVAVLAIVYKLHIESQKSDIFNVASHI